LLRACALRAGVCQFKRVGVDAVTEVGTGTLVALIAVLGFTWENDDRWLATWGGAAVGIIPG
jgi:hypothetical protein